MHSNTPSMVYIRRGKTTSKNLRSCDTVSAGAFFPQTQLQMPQKDMRQPRRPHMVVPAGIFAHFIVIHPECRFPFFDAWLDGPPHPTEPDKGPNLAKGQILANVALCRVCQWQTFVHVQGKGPVRVHV